MSGDWISVTSTGSPDLAAFDWIVISSSAGKDSQAMLDVIGRQALEQGLQDRVVVVHADLGRAEWEGTGELAQEHAEAYGFRFEVVRRKRGDLVDRIRQRYETLRAQGKDTPPWPTAANRYCTAELKRDQIKQLFTALVRESRAAGVTRRVRILDCQGLRADESVARAGKIAGFVLRNGGPFEVSAPKSNGKREVTEFYPIADWNEDQVWARIDAAGTRYHHAYDLGMPRLSCVFCIFAPRDALMIAGENNRALLDEYVGMEEEYGSSFKQGLALSEIRDALDAGAHVKRAAGWTEAA